MRQLVDAHYFSESLHFQFIEKNITKTTALDVVDVVDAVRQRKGLMTTWTSLSHVCELREQKVHTEYMSTENKKDIKNMK